MDLKEILRTVNKPASYINNEEGSIHKEWSQMALKVALCFPEKYEIGMSNKGLEILYFLGNELLDIVVERSYTPDIDMLAGMQKQQLPLFSWESHKPLKEFDLVGFSLPYELIYSNFLLTLDLARISLWQKERQESEPLIFAGGPAMFNPEPLADFLDFVIIGEGEFLFEKILTELARPEIKKLNREEKLHQLLKLDIDGIYIPKFKNRVKKHFIKDFNQLKIIEKQLVPLTKVVHDRSSVEIMRGCLHGCRFCHAGFTCRPLRPKNKDKILKEADLLLKNSGYQEISLLSLTVTDHPEIEDIVGELNKKFAGEKINISLPSLRTDSISEKLLQEIQKVRKSTITIAPEAGTQRLRDAIHKEMSEENIMRAAKIAIESGARSLKLYFMIGLPTETAEDILGITELAKKIIEENNQFKNFTITINVSNFVPKSHTPFQWAKAMDFAETLEKQKFIKENINHKRLKFRYHDAKTSILEALLSRGGRESSRVIHTAYQKGCRFDAWQEHFDFEKWLEAFAECGFDYHKLLAARDIETDLPWDHIETGVSKGYLKKEYLDTFKKIG